MQCKGQLFCHFSPIQSHQNDFICLVLTDFPSKTDLALTKTLIQEDFPFINRVHLPNHSEIQCYFQSMTDLIELDQGRKYGAAKAFIRSDNPQAPISTGQDEIQKPHGVSSNSSQTFESQTLGVQPSYKYIPSVKNIKTLSQKIDQRLLHHPRNQRLTSLEDEIQEIENLREELGLFKDDIDWENTGITEFVGDESEEEGEGKSAGQNQTQFKNSQDRLLDHSNSNAQEIQSCQQARNKQTGKEVILSLIEGAALTGVLIGGYKLLKNLIG